MQIDLGVTPNIANESFSQCHQLSCQSAAAKDRRHTEVEHIRLGGNALLGASPILPYATIVGPQRDIDQGHHLALVEVAGSCITKNQTQLRNDCGAKRYRPPERRPQHILEYAALRAQPTRQSTLHALRFRSVCLKYLCQELRATAQIREIGDEGLQVLRRPQQVLQLLRGAALEQLRQRHRAPPRRSRRRPPASSPHLPPSPLLAPPARREGTERRADDATACQRTAR
mmetsp:Transcript_40650/g.130854  ORF Transcript_40650/g.130854 Transcript_40650/m.130854 type:complete len:229 (+) Transcript_40650:421-1107(+)